jgi:hypothetical protein
MIARRVAAKARAPHLTKARNLLKKGQLTLRRRHGEVNVETPDCALEILQRGEPVTLRAWRCVSVGTHGILDPDKYEIVGDLLVQI